MTAGTVVVHATHAHCDGRGHEVTVVTDGHSLYATAAGHDLDTDYVERDGTRISLPCPVPETDRTPACHGTVTVDLSCALWRAATPTDRYVLTDAPRIERIDQ